MGEAPTHSHSPSIPLIDNSDFADMCPGWAKDGQCVPGTANYNPWMLRNCQKSCMEAGDNFPTAGPNGGPQPTTATDDAPTFSPTTPLPTGFPSTPVPSPG